MTQKVIMFLCNNCKYDSRVLREAKTLALTGYDLKIIAIRDNETPCSEFRDGFRIIRPIKRREFKRKYFLVIFLYSIYFQFKYYLLSWIIARKEPADIYHCHDLFTLPIGFIAKSLKGGKLVYDSHELFVEQPGIKFPRKLLYKMLEQFLIRFADKVITVNESIAEELVKRYNVPVPTVLLNCPPKSSISHIHYARSLRDTLDISTDIPIILYTGGYMRGRGLYNLILSAHHLKVGTIVFLGYGADENNLRKMVKSENLENRVIFSEPVSPDILINYTASASVGTALIEAICLSNYYASPNKLFEYISAGLPIVCSDLPYMKKVVEGYNIGKTCNPNDPKDIATAINWVLDDNKKYQELKNNVQKAATIFNWENESKKLLSLYNELGMTSAEKL